MSCLFRSLSHFVYNLGDDELRQIICNYLESDPLIMGDKFSSWLQILSSNGHNNHNNYNNFNNNEGGGGGHRNYNHNIHTMNIPSMMMTGMEETNACVASYVNTMRQPSTWGGGIEIHCFCELFETRVLVHGQHSKPIEFIPSYGKYENTIHISYNGFHYEPLRIS